MQKTQLNMYIPNHHQQLQHADQAYFGIWNRSAPFNREQPYSQRYFKYRTVHFW